MAYGLRVCGPGMDMYRVVVRSSNNMYVPAARPMDTETRVRPLVPAMIFTWWIPQTVFLVIMALSLETTRPGPTDWFSGHRVKPIARLHSWTAASTWRPSLGMGVKRNFGRDRSNFILASGLFAGPALPGFNTVQSPDCLVLSWPRTEN